MAASINARYVLGLIVSLVVCVSWAQVPAAYQSAGHEGGVPATVLYAIALQESGLRLRQRHVPWPWTLNVAGTSRYYATRRLACSALLNALRQHAAKRIDVGLTQINLGYQRRYYRQPCELLNPYRNLAVATAILRQQRRPGESWLPAIGRYHHPAGGAIAARYRRNVGNQLSRLISSEPTTGRRP